MARNNNASIVATIPNLPIQGDGREVIGDRANLLPRASHPSPEVELVEYSVDGELWRCGRFATLAAEMENGLTLDRMPEWHKLLAPAAKESSRRWTLLVRIFGLRPVMVGMSADPDDLRTWEREELREHFQLTKAQLQTELDAVRGTWAAYAERNKVKEVEVSREPRETVGGSPALPFDDDGELLLRQFNLTHIRLRQEERDWFIGRVRVFEKVLKEDFVSDLAINALTTALNLRRQDEYINTCKPGDGSYQKAIQLRQTLDTDFQKQMGQLEEFCPWARNIVGKYAFTGQLSDITNALQVYEAKGDTALIDGIFSATDIQILTRRSVQAPLPQYRAGAVVYLNAAKAGLWNKEWASHFTHGQLKKIQAAWTAAAVAVGDESGERVPDLTADGPEGEYEELQQGN